MSHKHQEETLYEEKIASSYGEEEKHYDDILTMSEDTEKSDELSPELQAAEKSLVWKLDFLYVMPCVAILNFLQV
jgi:hypothetical protein